METLGVILSEFPKSLQKLVMPYCRCYVIALLILTPYSSFMAVGKFILSYQMMLFSWLNFLNGRRGVTSSIVLCCIIPLAMHPRLQRFNTCRLTAWGREMSTHLHSCNGYGTLCLYFTIVHKSSQTRPAAPWLVVALLVLFLVSDWWWGGRLSLT